MHRTALSWELQKILLDSSAPPAPGHQARPMATALPPSGRQASARLRAASLLAESEGPESVDQRCYLRLAMRGLARVEPLFAYAAAPSGLPCNDRSTCAPCCRRRSPAAAQRRAAGFLDALTGRTTRRVCWDCWGITRTLASAGPARIDHRPRLREDRLGRTIHRHQCGNARAVRRRESARTGSGTLRS